MASPAAGRPDGVHDVPLLGVLANCVLEDAQQHLRSLTHLGVPGRIRRVQDLGIHHRVDPVSVAEQQDRHDRGTGPNGDFDGTDRDRRRLAEELQRLAVADEIAIKRHRNDARPSGAP